MHVAQIAMKEIKIHTREVAVLHTGTVTNNSKKMQTSELIDSDVCIFIWVEKLT